MFTGIITDIGTIVSIEKHGDVRAIIKTNYDMSGVAIGASVACSGVWSVFSRSFDRTKVNGWVHNLHTFLECHDCQQLRLSELPQLWVEHLDDTYQEIIDVNGEGTHYMNDVDD